MSNLQTVESLEELPEEAKQFEVRQCSDCEKFFTIGYDFEQWKAHQHQLHFPFVKECPLLIEPSEGLIAELYDTPWKKEPHVHWFCSDSCEEQYIHPGDFNYHFCESCNRQVCYQNPRNGWHIQFRDREYLGSMCLKCYEEEILENGQPEEDFEGDTIHGGMFFSYGNIQPRNKGFTEVPAFSDYFIRDLPSIRKYNNKALELIKKEVLKVITCYERLAIGGSEGYFTMMTR